MSPTPPEPDYVVLRAGPDLPEGYLAPHAEGRWLDRSAPGGWAGHPGSGQELQKVGALIGLPTGRFETRAADGAVAEVYELQLAGPMVCYVGGPADGRLTPLAFHRDQDGAITSLVRVPDPAGHWHLYHVEASDEPAAFAEYVARYAGPRPH